MKKYTIETLGVINSRFLSAHLEINQSDVDMVNELIKNVEESRSASKPTPGDIVEYINEYGDYFSNAHIEAIEGKTINLCERASTYISKSNENTLFYSSSGGTWKHIEIDKFEYVGTTEKRFWFFGHCGACADGGIDFYATVNVWKCNLNKEPFSTKTHDKYYISFSNRKEDVYHYFASKNGVSSCAWKTKKEFQAWLRTYRAIINDHIVWTYKEVEHHVSPVEYDNLNATEDIIQMNGKRLCKRIYDNENFILHTYFVWYWDDPTIEDYMERYSKQNEIRKRYELDYTAIVNSYAMEELRTEKVKSIELNL